MKTMAKEDRRKQVKDMSTYGFKFVRGFRRWVKYGSSPEDVECGAIFSHGMAVCKLGPKVTVKCDTRQNGKLRSIRVGCGCQKLRVMVKVAGFMPSELANMCAGQMQVWSRNLQQRFMRTEATELCAANVIEKCNKIGENARKQASLKTMEASTARLGKLADFDDTLRQIVRQNSKEQHVLTTLHHALKAPTYSYAKLPGFSLPTSASDSESDMVCRNKCDRSAACKSYSFSKVLGKCSTSINTLDYDDDFVLYIKSQSVGEKHFAEIAGLKIGRDTKKVSAMMGEQACKYECLLNEECTCVSYSKSRGLCIRSGFKIALGSDWDYYEKGKREHRGTQEEANYFEPHFMDTNHKVQSDSISEAIQRWKVTTENTNQKAPTPQP